MCVVGLPRGNSAADLVVDRVCEAVFFHLPPSQEASVQMTSVAPTVVRVMVTLLAIVATVGRASMMTCQNLFLWVGGE